MAGGSSISLETATTWCDNFRTENPGATKAYLYDKSLIESIIDQSGCDGLRFYNAINDDEDLCIVLVGTDSGEDMTGGTLVERGNACPPSCDTDSPLNVGS